MTKHNHITRDMKDKLIEELKETIFVYKKENEELKLALIDRTEKYSIAIDKGVMELSSKYKEALDLLEVIYNSEYQNGLYAIEEDKVQKLLKNEGRI